MSPGSSLELVDDFEDASEEEQPDDGSQRFIAFIPSRPDGAFALTLPRSKFGGPHRLEATRMIARARKAPRTRARSPLSEASRGGRRGARVHSLASVRPC